MNWDNKRQSVTKFFLDGSDNRSYHDYKGLIWAVNNSIFLTYTTTVLKQILSALD